MKRLVLLSALASVVGAAQNAFADETAVAITPNPISLGSGPPSKLTQTVQVTNNTGDTIDITNVTVGGPFQVTGATPPTLAPGASASFTANVPGGTSPGSYADTLSVDYTDEATTDQLSVSDPISATVTAPVRFTTPATVSLARFYPLVVDGYRDSVTYTAHLSERANVVVRVVNAKGVVRKSWTLSNVLNPSVLWRGLNLHHKKVDPGSYRFQAFAKVPGFPLVKGGVLTVKVVTGFRFVLHSDIENARGAAYSASGCIHHVYGSGYLVDCRASSIGGSVVFRRRFPRTAVVGTRGMAEIWAYNVHAAKFGRSWLVGRTVYQTLKVRSANAVLFTKMKWVWKTKIRI